MSRIDNQRRLFLELIEELRPWWRRDPGLPQRLNAWLARHRAGSRDRRLYRELAYTSWRILPWIEDASPEILVARVANHAEVIRDTAEFVAAYRTDESASSGVVSDLLPLWLPDQCSATQDPDVVTSLLSRAPLWVRIQTSDAKTVTDEMETLGITWETSPHLSNAIRLPAGINLASTQVLQKGLIEVQDIGSQALLNSLPHAPGGRWLDACAGAGGKTLQLAALLGETGSVVVHDIRPAAMRELAKRQKRAGLPNITTTTTLDGKFEGVLVDAPCTGSGTWRRSPHLKWTTSPETIRRAQDRQIRLLGEFGKFVQLGGLLVYATCSLCRDENEAVADHFDQMYPAFRPEKLRHPIDGREIAAGRLTLLPNELDSDAYFVAAWRRS